VQHAAARVQEWLRSVEPAAPKPAEEIAGMSAAQRLEYARQFDQSKMPVWKDPRNG
jgi:hypothetical protein